MYSHVLPVFLIVSEVSAFVNLTEILLPPIVAALELFFQNSSYVLFASNRNLSLIGHSFVLWA